MSTTIDQAFITAYQADVVEVFQRHGGLLRDAVRMRTGVVGSTATFQKIATGVATTKARHGTITPMNQTHTAVSASIVDFYAGDWVDRLDLAKTNIDERMAIARGGAWALGRKVDNQLITALDTTTETTITISTANKASLYAKVLEWIEGLDRNDVPNDGQRYGIVTPRLYSQLLTIDSFARASYVGQGPQLPLVSGAPVQEMWKDWQNVKWKVHSDCPNRGLSTAKCYVWHKNAIAYATGAHPQNNAESDMVQADITWHGDRAAHFINHMMSGGAVLVDSTGVIEATIDDTVGILTS